MNLIHNSFKVLCDVICFQNKLRDSILFSNMLIINTIISSIPKNSNPGLKQKKEINSIERKQSFHCL